MAKRKKREQGTSRGSRAGGAAGGKPGRKIYDLNHLRSAQQTWQDGSMADDPDKLKEGFGRARAADTAAKALASRLVPEPTRNDIAELERIIEAARQTPPLDKAGFVRDVNRILDAQNLRLRVENGLARLGVRNGSIQFTVSGFGGRGLKTPFSIVEVPADYARQRQKPGTPNPQ